MNRLQTELQRLYGAPGAQPEAAPDAPVRAMVLELGRPASWDALAKAWRGVQADLDLPAPAIAVTGTDGYQLWFSLAQPVPVAQALAFLGLVSRRYLGGIAAERIGMHASPDAAAPGQRDLPPVQRAAGRWSAFVAPDLAAVFADEPWLDLAPGVDAQADLLYRVGSIDADDWKRALDKLGPGADPAAAGPAPAAAAGGSDPRRFLRQVMDDGSVDLRLRIEAAKALLPYAEAERRL